ncbi:MAG TPA: LuxR C-terminal-related transcriptional regulator [Geobacteraceae bacterium]|nr:LuxR C-terminal-related transcriptional regulator [Geobacteraceae bacterium]
MYDNTEGIIVTAFEPSELRFCLSGSDAITLLEFIHKSLHCETKEDYMALFPKIKELIPFDFVNTCLAHHDANNDLVVAYNANVSFPREWLEVYAEKGYLFRDVIVSQNYASFKVQYWDLARLRQSHQDEGLLTLCFDHGMNSCYAHGSRLAVTGKNGSMFCYTGMDIEMNKRTDAILEFVTPHLHLALSHLYSNKQLEWNRGTISQREKEVLEWLKQGKNSWDISVILAISERTVNYHVYNIMEKLGVTNRPQAVAVATRLGLIDFD